MDPGVSANERLTAVASVTVLAALLALLATTPTLGLLMWPHVLVGVAVVGPTSLKLRRSRP